jgi:release factor glutamine methyltransferase
MTSLREAVRGATHVLAEAGVASAPVDALVLAAHALGVEVSEARRLLIVGGVEVPPEYAALVAERARRVPLQHLTGEAHFRGLTLRVGPGVFVPRPETETLVSLALDAIDAVGSDGAGDPVGPVDRATTVGAGGADGPATVVDLCTGSGAIAFSLKAERPDLVVEPSRQTPWRTPGPLPIATGSASMSRWTWEMRGRHTPSWSGPSMW